MIVFDICPDLTNDYNYSKAVDYSKYSVVEITLSYVSVVYLLFCIFVISILMLLPQEGHSTCKKFCSNSSQ